MKICCLLDDFSMPLGPGKFAVSPGSETAGLWLVPFPEIQHLHIKLMQRHTAAYIFHSEVRFFSHSNIS